MKYVRRLLWLLLILVDHQVDQNAFGGVIEFVPRFVAEALKRLATFVDFSKTPFFLKLIFNKVSKNFIERNKNVLVFRLIFKRY